MTRKGRKHGQQSDFDPYDDYSETYDEDVDINELAKDFYSAGWDEFCETDRRFTARRKIERRRDMKRLYSQLDEWEEFGDLLEF